MKIKYTSLSLLAFLVPVLSEAQCAMCRAVLESGENTAVAEGINNGILYLMAVPYLLVGGVFFVIYRKLKT
jgi:hypothetical protein